MGVIMLTDTPTPALIDEQRAEIVRQDAKTDTMLDSTGVVYHQSALWAEHGAALLASDTYNATQLAAAQQEIAALRERAERAEATAEDLRRDLRTYRDELTHVCGAIDAALEMTATTAPSQPEAEKM